MAASSASLKPASRRASSLKGGWELRSGKQKASLYRFLENQVMAVARAHLEARGTHYFLEHDGFISDKPVDLAELESEIKDQTGWSVKFSRAHSIAEQESLELEEEVEEELENSRIETL